MKKYYDSVYPGMAPIYCLGPSEHFPADWNCVVRVGESYGIPLFTHRGANKTYPVRCNCTSSAANNTLCDQFDFMIGVAVHDFQSNSSAIDSYPELFRPFIPIIELFYTGNKVSVKVIISICTHQNLACH